MSNTLIELEGRILANRIPQLEKVSFFRRIFTACYDRVSSDKLVSQLSAIIFLKNNSLENAEDKLKKSRNIVEQKNAEVAEAKAEIQRLKEKHKKDIDRLESINNNKSDFYTEEIAGLNKKIKQINDAAESKRSKELKTCTDKFMKTINKLEKENAKLQKAASANKFAKTGKPKLTCPQAVEIRESTKGFTELAEQYNVSTATIRRIKKKQSYKDC